MDPSDQSKKQAYLVVGAFTVPTHAYSDTSHEILMGVYVYALAAILLPGSLYETHINVGYGS